MSAKSASLLSVGLGMLVSILSIRSIPNVVRVQEVIELIQDRVSIFVLDTLSHLSAFSLLHDLEWQTWSSFWNQSFGIPSRNSACRRNHGDDFLFSLDSRIWYVLRTLHLIFVPEVGIDELVASHSLPSAKPFIKSLSWRNDKYFKREIEQFHPYAF